MAVVYDVAGAPAIVRVHAVLTSLLLLSSSQLQAFPAVANVSDVGALAVGGFPTVAFVACCCWRLCCGDVFSIPRFFTGFVGFLAVSGVPTVIGVLAGAIVVAVDVFAVATVMSVHMLAFFCSFLLCLASYFVNIRGVAGILAVCTHTCQL